MSITRPGRRWSALFTRLMLVLIGLFAVVVYAGGAIHPTVHYGPYAEAARLPLPTIEQGQLHQYVDAMCLNAPWRHDHNRICNDAAVYDEMYGLAHDPLLKIMKGTPW